MRLAGGVFRETGKIRCGTGRQQRLLPASGNAQTLLCRILSIRTNDAGITAGVYRSIGQKICLKEKHGATERNNGEESAAKYDEILLMG
ncbi:MAG: hypothetical protein DYG98_06565 [Haliscomenobacteraceae bacterium CHB4]|nr:hypothetical protein [Saprospiraceae bacterium]MCE7922700.1 hypothetical protein [Haliscomenobacteraceae bacterium CHB4]